MRSPTKPRTSSTRLMRLWTTLPATLIVALLHWAVWEYNRYEQQVRDVLVNVGRRAEQDPSIIMLGIDSASKTLDEPWPDEIAASPALQKMKESGWPWPRDVYAAVVERLVSAGAKVVAFDLMLDTQREGDAELKAALDKYPGKVVLGSNLYEADEGARIPITPPAPTIIAGDAKYDPRVGFVNFRPEADFKVRRALYHTTLLQYAGRDPSPDEKPLFSLAARIAQQAGAGDKIPPRGETRLFRYHSLNTPQSLYKIFVPALWAAPPFNGGQMFKDKIVLVGPYGEWSKDFIETPIGRIAGPQVHIAALNALVRGEFLKEGSTEVNLLLIGLGGAVAFLLGGLVKQQVLRIAALAGAGGAYFGGALLLYNSVGLFPILLSPLLALFLSGGSWLALEHLLEVRERMRTRRFLERYVSKDVVREVLDNKESFLHTMQGIRKNVTVMFSDVRGFTTVTESGDAQQLVKQLNEYFTEMVRIVFANDGTLDKFIGDAVMATWGGIPKEGRDEAKDACQGVEAALQMLRTLRRLNTDWKTRGLLELKIGIGVNHGPAVCGNLGSEQKQEFTVIGDAVNMASRIEGATKEFHVDLLIGAETARLVRETQVVRTVDLLQLKGKTKPAEVFTVLDGVTEAPGWLRDYEEGVRLYRARDFAAAMAEFRRVAEAMPEDYLTQMYLNRCEHYVQEPPSAAWSGVYVMATK